MHIRKEIAKALRLKLPKGWRVIEFPAVPANPSQPVIIMRSSTIAKTPGAPRRYRTRGYMLGLIVPELDPEKAEDALDDAIETLVNALEEVDFPGLLWSEATRAKFDDRFQGYDVPVNITTQKE